MSDSGSADKNSFDFDVTAPVSQEGPAPPTGNLTVSGTDANGTHSYSASADCLFADNTVGNITVDQGTTPVD